MELDEQAYGRTALNYRNWSFVWWARFIVLALIFLLGRCTPIGVATLDGPGECCSSCTSALRIKPLFGLWSLITVLVLFGLSYFNTYLTAPGE